MMRFKEKKTSKGIATIYLRLLDNARYFPLLTVTDLSGKQVLHSGENQNVHIIAARGGHYASHIENVYKCKCNMNKINWTSDF